MMGKNRQYTEYLKAKDTVEKLIGKRLSDMEAEFYQNGFYRGYLAGMRDEYREAKE